MLAMDIASNRLPVIRTGLRVVTRMPRVGTLRNTLPEMTTDGVAVMFSTTVPPISTPTGTGRSKVTVIEVSDFVWSMPLGPSTAVAFTLRSSRVTRQRSPLAGGGFKTTRTSTAPAGSPWPGLRQVWTPAFSFRPLLGAGVLGAVLVVCLRCVVTGAIRMSAGLVWVGLLLHGWVRVGGSVGCAIFPYSARTLCDANRPSS
ncbi:hypothetical protein [Streptomyces mirabilis]|uniref:hypothetical protein n=1 Tax=Streptomyces mirabilis TaxID=68239 RepID=UPI0036B7EE0F